MSGECDKCGECDFYGEYCLECKCEKPRNNGWIRVRDEAPKIGAFIATLRIPYPSYYWIGFYDDRKRDEEDEFSYWMPLPEPPKD